ncbi:MAG: DUF4124 domain-containing protein [Halioglobus sp.]|nr:DUF4124 domain-containing protein [Halioglobus sp.]
MKRTIVIALLFLAPQLASARVYMCVDHATGATSFTDKACETVSSREEVRVDPANLDSGKRYKEAPKNKIWRSQEDKRKTGMDYNAERRSIYENKATASTR